MTATFTAVTALGIAIMFALTLHHQREIVWGVPEHLQREYQQWRARVDNALGRE